MIKAVVSWMVALAVFMMALPQELNAQTKGEGLYNLNAQSLAGSDVKMKKFKGHYILVVNTASECGYTPQFEGLEKLYNKYIDNGFVILGFPCNQFGNQESGDNAAISEVCHANYGVTFPMFSKIEVNGENEHPIYTYLKAQKPGDIEWNFTKFLVDPKGNVIERFGSKVTPEEIEKVVEKLY